MSILDWAFDVDARRLAADERQRERARGAVALAQAKALRRHKRRDTRMRVFGWCRRNKMAVYPVGAVASFATGLFTVGLLPGFLALAVGLVVLEWRFSR